MLQRKIAISFLSFFACFFGFEKCVNDLNAQTPPDQNEIYQDFLNHAKVKWAKQLNSIGSYSVVCNVERKNEGLPTDKGGSARVQAKRLGRQFLVESFDESSQKGKTAAINSEYHFQLEKTNSQQWHVAEVDGNEGDKLNEINRTISNSVFQSDFMHLMICRAMRLTEIPWENSDAVKLVTAKAIEDHGDHRIVELTFDFNFDDSVKNILGRSDRGFKSGTFVFETLNWKMLSSIIDYDSGREKIKFFHNNNFDSEGRLSSRIDRLDFIGIDLISVVTIDQFEWLPIPKASEFRLPHYGLPEFKAKSTSWWWSILFLAVALAAVAYYAKTKK